MQNRIDWRELLHDNNIEFIERGPNVRRGELNIQCPLCRSADPSYHMGINPDTGWWSCWRNRHEHSGKSPVRLLMHMLRISYESALELAGLSPDYVDPDGFGALAIRVRRDGIGAAAPPDVEQRAPLELDRDFQPLNNVERAWRYMHGRGFTNPGRLTDEYGVYAAMHGDQRHRVVFTYVVLGALMTWSGRTVGNSEVRYRDLELKRPDGVRGQVAIAGPKKVLYNHDATIEGGNWLFVVEGPVDTLKLDYYGKTYGCRAVGLSTNSISDEQLFQLEAAAERFKHVGVMMDTAKKLHIIDSMKMRARLATIKTPTRILPPPGRRKDAGEATAWEVDDLCRQLTT